MAKATRNSPKKSKQFEVNGSLWIESNGERFFGPGPVELLERIEKTGSINQAARQMEMSYKKPGKSSTLWTQAPGICLLLPRQEEPAAADQQLRLRPGKWFPAIAS